MTAPSTSTESSETCDDVALQETALSPPRTLRDSDVSCPRSPVASVLRDRTVTFMGKFGILGLWCGHIGPTSQLL